MLERIQQKWIPVLRQNSLQTYKNGEFPSREPDATSLENALYIDERC
jgi:hypothetical protein